MKTFLTILGLLAVIAGGIYIWQRDALSMPAGSETAAAGTVYETAVGSFAVSYNADRTMATLTFGGMQYALVRTATATSTTYETADGMTTLVVEGATATLARNGGTPVVGVSADGTAADPLSQTDTATSTEVAATTTATSTAAVTTAVLGEWGWKETNNLDGTVITPVDPAAFSITFRDAGTVAIATDCNSGVGSYTVGDDGSLRFGQIATTKKACPGQTQESAFYDMLPQVRGYKRVADALVLTFADDAGTMLMSAR